MKREDIQTGAMQASAMLEAAGFKAGMTVDKGRITRFSSPPGDECKSWR
ncbi:hypothetical protein [Pseudomonas chlororaphis]|nr:hypothetical protein [Pseudomonas chlororaphis]WDH43182.1 hypothetical protein PUP51_09755 [Pseudomonas chlororaphis]